MTSTDDTKPVDPTATANPATVSPTVTVAVPLVASVHVPVFQ